MFDLLSGQEFTSNILPLGIHIKFQAKVPGSAQEMRLVDMAFHYRSSFGIERLPDACERLLLDALEGDASLFARSDEIEETWQLIGPHPARLGVASRATPGHLRAGQLGAG